MVETLMDVVLLIVEALKFIFPAYCANGTPVLGRRRHKDGFWQKLHRWQTHLWQQQDFSGFLLRLGSRLLGGDSRRLSFWLRQFPCTV